MNALNFFLKLFQLLTRFFTWAGDRIQAEINARIAHRQKMELELARRNYLRDYWYLALVLWEISRAKSALLRIIPPQVPLELEALNRKVAVFREFCFKFQRSRENALHADGAVLRHEVVDYLDHELRSRGFQNFQIQCSEDAHFYYIYFRCLGGFKSGRTISTRFGNLRVRGYFRPDNKQPAADPHTGQHLNFVVDFYYDGNSGGLQDNVPLLVYHEGRFIQVRTTRNSFLNPDLIGKPYGTPGFGYIVYL
jgi:hypothetical protein